MSGWYYLARWVAVALISALALGDGHHGWIALALGVLLGLGLSGGFLHRRRA